MNMQKTAIAAALFLATGSAFAAPVSTGGIFAMSVNLGLDQATTTPPSTGSVATDATISGVVDYAAGTWGVSSTTAFFGFQWTASNGGLVETAGNYVLDTTTGHVALGAPDATGTADGFMHFTVGAGQMAGIIDFAWSSTTGIRVVNVWDINADGSLTVAAAPGMENGPFPGYNAAFELTGPGLAPAPSAVPVPAAAWLFGSGLLGLVGVARRKKAA